MKTKPLSVSILLASAASLPAAMVFPITQTSRDSVIGEAEVPASRGYTVDTGGSQIGGAGAGGSRIQTNILYGFLLPVVPSGESVVSATLSFRITTAREENNATALPPLDTYLLDSADPSMETIAGVYLDAASDPNANNIFIGRTVETDLATDVGNSDTSYNKDFTYTFSPAAIARINSLYTGTDPGGREVFFRFNMGDAVNVDTLNRYNLGTGANAPVFTLNTDVVPEPSVALLGALGGILLLRRRR